MSVQIPDRSWQDRLGGPYAISTRSFLITSTLALLFFAQLQSLSTQSLRDISRWMAVYLLALVFLGLINYLLHKSIFSNRHIKPVSVQIALATHGIQGFLFAAILAIGGKLLELKQEFNLPLQLTLMTLVAMWWGSTLVIFRDHQHENNQSRRLLIEQAIAAESLAQSQKQSSQALDEVFRAGVSQDLSAVELELKQGRDRIDWPAASALLKNTAANQVRTMSHGFTNTTPLTYPRIRWWNLFTNIINNQPLNVGLTSVVVLVSGTSQLTQLFGARNALTLIGIVIALIVGIGVPANRLMEKYPKHHALIFISAFLLMQISIPINVHFRNIWLPGVSTPSWQISQLVLGFSLIILTSGFGAWSKINERLNANLKEDLKEQHIQAIASSRQFAERAREASKVLHGAVQSKLVACALAIDQAAIKGDEQRIREAIDHALVILKTPLTTEAIGSSILEEVKRKVSLWSEICEIQVEVFDPHFLSDSAKVLLVGRVIEEAISNAIRHGRAKKITISIIVDEDNGIDIHVVDNGTGPKNGKPSLGSALLNQASSGHWSLTRTEKGTDLHLVIGG